VDNGYLRPSTKQDILARKEGSYGSQREREEIQEKDNKYA